MSVLLFPRSSKILLATAMVNAYFVLQDSGKGICLLLASQEDELETMESKDKGRREHKCRLMQGSSGQIAASLMMTFQCASISSVAWIVR